MRVPIEAAANQACMPTQVKDTGKVGPEEDAQVQVQVQKPLKGNMKVITTTGDWNCFFCSIATALHVNLKVCVRDGNGVPQDPHCKILENTQSTNLRTRMAAFMKKNSDEYEDMDQDVLNLDMPSHVRFQCYKDRINAMSKLNTMPGELEIIAMTNMLKKTLKILKHSGEIIYGADYKTSPIVLQFTDIGEYVSHYDCILEDQEEGKSQSTDLK